ncbi:transcription termination factor 1, mitochondrial [Ascaphus truei]|uniref:transcription termination factor 1, mitochondrial n=1 Tax=Ascaphus truei TaxID=8439 RepID=UPI003F5A41F5
MALKGLIRVTGLCVYHMKYTSVVTSNRALATTVSCRYSCTKLPAEIQQQSQENMTLVSNLEIMGVDITMARMRQPGVLKRMITHEESLAKFLLSKGASKQTIANIVSRYPRAITRTHEHLHKKWEIWQSILKTDSDILKIVERSPESFFRSENIENLEENIIFLSSLGLTPKDLSRLLAKAPRTFSNRTELNKQIVDFLKDVYLCLGGETPQDFVRHIISKNIFLLIRSTKRLKANIDFLQSALQLTDRELLVFIQGHGAEILDLCHNYIKKNFANAQQKLLSIGCSEAEITRCIISCPSMLYLSHLNFVTKIDILVEAGINSHQILERPRVLDVSVDTIKGRIKDLADIDYDYQALGISILELSKSRFEARFKKLRDSK